MPISIPSGVDVRIQGSSVTVKGPRGELDRDVDPDMRLAVTDGQILVSRPSEQQRHRAQHGLTRSLLANMVIGVSEGYTKTLEMQGVGYRAQMQGSDLVLAVGYSHLVRVPPPPGIEFEVDGTTRLLVKGISKELGGAGGCRRP